jgi:hypothetical protein
MQSTRQAESDPSCGVEEVLQFDTSFGDVEFEAPAKRQEQEAAAEATAAEGQEQEAIGEGQEQEQEAAAKKQEQEAVAKTQRQEQEAAAKRQEQERMRQRKTRPRPNSNVRNLMSIFLKIILLMCAECWLKRSHNCSDCLLHTIFDHAS